MNDRIRAGVIGCGAIAQALHLPGYAKCRGVSLVAACDPSPARRKEVKATYPDIRTYADHTVMLKAEGLDMVSVASPNRYHAGQACAALRAGANVLLEKPPALTLGEMGKIQQAERHSGRKVIVGFTQRFTRGNIRAKKVLEDGVIGEPYMMRVRFAHTGPYPGWAKSKWFYDPALAGGGALLDMGIHAIDLAIWMLGPVKRVQARSATLRKKIKVDDNAVVLLEFVGGRALAYVEVGWTSPSGFTGWEICGDEGSMVFDYQGKLVLHRGQRDPSGAVTGLRMRVLDAKPMTWGWATEIRDAVKLFKAGKGGAFGTGPARHALAVALGAYESSRTGRRVTIRK